MKNNYRLNVIQHAKILDTKTHTTSISVNFNKCTFPSQYQQNCLKITGHFNGTKTERNASGKKRLLIIQALCELFTFNQVSP